MRVNRPENFNVGNLINISKIDIENLPKAHRFPSIMSDKEKIKNIKDIEKIVRSSLEYRELVKYLKEYVDLNRCAFFTKVAQTPRKKISIEIHHEPFTLYDICAIVLDKHDYMNKPINHFDIAKEVLWLHYTGRVGLIPLSLTVHELVHEGKVFIPIQDIYGKRFVNFVKEYAQFISPEIRNILNEKMDISREIVTQQDLTILERKYVYLDIDGMRFPTIQKHADIVADVE